jgi:hypothetical protein
MLPPMLWHYTSGAGLRGILESRSFWATNLLYLDDYREFRFAGEVMGNVLAQLRDEEAAPEIRSALVTLQELISRRDPLVTPDLYICCFTSRGNNPNVWRRHTQLADAYNIGVDGLFLFSHGLQNWQLRKCIYAEAEQRVLVHEVLHRRVDELKQGDDLQRVIPALAHEMGGLAPVLKHREFEDEDEWRMIHYPSRYVKYANGEELPEIAVAPNGSPHAILPLDDTLPPVRITLRPDPYSRLDENDVIAMGAATGIIATTSRSDRLLEPTPIVLTRVGFHNSSFQQ